MLSLCWELGIVLGTFRHLPVAVKVLRCNILDEVDTSGFRHEMSLLSHLQHPHICLFIGYRLKPDLSVVMEYCPGGDLGEAAKDMPLLVKVSVVTVLTPVLVLLIVRLWCLTGGKVD